MASAPQSSGEPARSPASSGLSGRTIPIVLIAVLGPVVAAVVLRVFVVEAFKVPSGSMVPAVEMGDHMFVSKWDKVARRGDVIVFKYPENPEQDFVKRVVALGGDKLEILDGRPAVNDVLAPQCYVGSYTSSGVTKPLYLEKLGASIHGVLHSQRVGEKTCATDADCGAQSCKIGICVGESKGPYSVSPGEVWVLGDNRDNSHDSPMWNHGLGRGVPLDFVIGKPTFLFVAASSGRFGANVQGVPQLVGENAGLEPGIEKCVAELSKSP